MMFTLCTAVLSTGRRLLLLTHQQAGGHGDDVAHGVFSGDVLPGIGNVAENAAVDDGAEDEVNVPDQNEH